MPPQRNQWSGPSDTEIREAQAAVRIFLGLNRQARIGVVVLLLIVGIFVAVAYFHSQQAQQSASLSSPQMLLGNPSGATSSFTNRDNYLMVKPYYALSYNSSTGCPNWVSWQVIESDLGTAPRKQVFDPDETLPAAMYAVMQHDYSGSGFDRGHMCPHSDRAANQEMSFSTFVMSNIIPQAPNVNRKAWAQLEMYCRELVSRERDHLYITSGPDGRGGRGSEGFRDTIGDGRVVVPAGCWKIVVVVPESGGFDDLANINAGTRVIAVEMPNDNDIVGEEWAGFRTSVSAVEARTGLHFFDRVPQAVAEVLKAKIDNAYIPPPRPMHFEKD